MSVLFTMLFETTIIHVLHVRGRTAFLALELGAAAGHADGGQALVDLIMREWPACLDEDDDVAQLVGKELDALKREVPLPADTTTALVLFATGVDRVLGLSHARHARSLRSKLHRDALSRVVTFGPMKTPTDDSDGGQGGAPAETAPSPAPAPAEEPTDVVIMVSPELVETVDKLGATQRGLAQLVKEVKQMATALHPESSGSSVLERLADDLIEERLISNVEWAALRVEATEEALGRRLRTYLPSLAEPTPNLPFAA